MSRRMLALSVVCLSFGLPGSSIAADHEVDSSFGPNGTGWHRLYEPGNATQDQFAVAHARTADGGYVVALEFPNGGANGGTGKRIGLQRLSQNGTLVTNWGTNGRVVKDAWLTSVIDMTIDAQGRIIVIGPTPGPGGVSDFGVVRFNADGTVDTSFAGDGGAAVGFDGALNWDDWPTSVLAEADGRIVVAGSTVPAGLKSRWAVLRLNENGTIDNSFGSIDDGQGGRRGSNDAFIDGEPASGERILKIASGYYVITGTTQFSSTDWDFAARILTPSGGQWANFAGSGRFSVDIPSGSIDQLRDAVLVNPTTILLVGDANDKFAALRIVASANGMGQYTQLALDTSFVGSAIPTTPFVFVGNTSNSSSASAAIDNEGRAWIVGVESFPGTVGKGLVMRLNPNGSLDSSFANGIGYSYNSAPITGGGNSTSHYTQLSKVSIVGSQAVLLGSAADGAVTHDDFDGVITRLQSGSLELFSDGFEP